jgi:hypothetical protein
MASEPKQTWRYCGARCDCGSVGHKHVRAYVTKTSLLPIYRLAQEFNQLFARQ